jgi:hypothetical protein
MMRRRDFIAGSVARRCGHWQRTRSSVSACDATAACDDEASPIQRRAHLRPQGEGEVMPLGGLFTHLRRGAAVVSPRRN